MSGLDPGNRNQKRADVGAQRVLTSLTRDPDLLERFCSRWKISELAVFGSALRDDFGADSDVDLLVTFVPGAEWTLFDIADMRQELGELFGREVDLIERNALRNPFRRYEIMRTRRVIYTG